MDEHSPVEETLDDSISTAHPAHELPKPEVEKKGGVSLVWLVPLVALAVGVWLIVKTYSERGPHITITFNSADGLTAGKTRIKHKSVEVGTVQTVTLAPDLSHVLVEADLVKGMEKNLSTNARFWVVRPRLSLSGVSGLGTLVSGAFIEIEPGKPGKMQSKFKGLESPPLVRSDTPGTKILLKAESLGSLTPGSPIYYRDIPAGEILGHDLTEDKKGVLIHAFVKMPYHFLVRENTRFWKASGIDVSMGADGVRVKTASLAKLIMGGVSFDTPETLEEGRPVPDGTNFSLFEDRESVADTAYARKIPFIMFFGGSVRGLKVGAPVEFRGIKIGSVTDIKMEFERSDTSFRVAVLVQIEPERVTEIGDEGGMNNPYELLETLVERGLRARLESGSYLTGQLFVNLVLAPDAPIKLVGVNTRYPELPTVPTSLEEIAATVTDIVTKVKKIPFDSIGVELEGTLKGLNKTVNAPEVLASLRSLDEALIELKQVAAKVDGQVVPMGKGIEEASRAATKALAQTEVLMTSMQEVMGPDAPLNYQILELSRELTATARSIRSFIDVMERKPESLVFGKDKEK